MKNQGKDEESKVKLQTRGQIFESNDEMIYEMDHIWTADMKSSEAMTLAVMNVIFAIA